MHVWLKLIIIAQGGSVASRRPEKAPLRKTPFSKPTAVRHYTK